MLPLVAGTVVCNRVPHSCDVPRKARQERRVVSYQKQEKQSEGQGQRTHKYQIKSEIKLRTKNNKCVPDFNCEAC